MKSDMKYDIPITLLGYTNLPCAGPVFRVVLFNIYIRTLLRMHIIDNFSLTILRNAYDQLIYGSFDADSRQQEECEGKPRTVH